MTDGDDASDAFGALGSETRMSVLQTLVEDGGPVDRSFSELFAASDEDTSAGFAYHLRQLVGTFVRKRADERYELTDAGLRVARGIAAGAYTDSVDREPVPLDEPCPFCEEQSLDARIADNVTTVGCTSCERDLLELPFPPAGYATHDDADLPEAFDRYHRHRIGAFDDGVCPTCGGNVQARIEPVDEGDDAGSEEPQPVTARYACEGCGDRLRCPVALTVVDHPGVVAFYHDHDEDVTDRPVWNVGGEWRETLLSTDPLAVRVTTRLDDDELALYVARDGSVVETQRRTAETAPPEAGAGDAEAAEAESA
ncbi:winged helix-turn-helix domain-containing protein [Haloarchaeobius salinus]|uniref:winged helix-turn-helix domain-containing protein n=1 Tax=Haloarchaeobius salinus TaxID=1198298 RepID=UPI00210CB667|nr:helix-turn-helix domain-containing protein [Haloarchaeobius salinus]